jgi:CheY-like chemotaxis protein
LILEINPCVPEFIISDSVRLKQIFSNLISNAIKFTSDGEVKTTIDAVKIANEYQIICPVKDSGIGISENSQNELFKSFNQVDNSVTRKHGGAGLGLSISRSLAEMLGGEINLSSQGIGTGSTFQFNFVTEESNDGILNLGDKMFDHHDGIDINFGKMYPLDILIVEDNVMNQQVIQTLLTKLGYVTDLAVDGVECLEKINEKTYDLIFMDIQMPRMDGITATIEIRKLTKFTNLSISAMTANAFDEDRDKCFNAGMDDFIAKPIKVEKLKEVITSVFTLNEKSSKDVG